MKYLSKNRLFDFEFHDSFAKTKEFDNHNLSLFVNALNLHKDAEQNEDGRCDLELGKAIIHFEKLKFERIEPLTPRNNDAIIEQPADLTELLLRELVQGGTILHLELSQPDHIKILMDFPESGFYRAEMVYDNVLVEWDEFLRPAWYEKE